MLKSVNSKHEICVCCKRRTAVLKTERVENRNYYICGVGQLCEQCFFEIQAEKRTWKSEMEMRKLLKMCAEEEK